MDLPPDVIDAARAALPAWVPWAGPAAALAVAAVLPAALLGLAFTPAARAARAPAEAPWTEVARRRWPVIAAVPYLVLVTAALMAFVAWNLGGEIARVRPRPLAGVSFFVAGCSAIAGIRFATRNLPGPPVGNANGLRGSLALAWITMGHAVVLAAMFLCMPLELGTRAAVVVAAGALAMLLWLRGGVLAVPRWIGVLHPLDARLEQRVAAAASAQGVDGVRGFELTAPTANAFAVLMSRALVVTGPLRTTLDDEQLDAILHHEVAHLGESRARIAAFTSRALATLPMPLAMPIGGEYGVGYALLAFVPTVALLIATRRVPRSFEEHADRAGAGHAVDESVYARALEAIHRANLIPAVLGGARPHPDLYDRMRTAGVEPDYPRPEPPSASATRGTTVAGTLAVAAAAIGTPILIGLQAEAAWEGEGSALLAFALSGGAPYYAGLPAEELDTAGDQPGAAALRRFAAWAEIDNPWGALAWASLHAPPAGEVAQVAERIEATLLDAPWRDVWAEVTLAELWVAAEQLDRAGAARDRGLALAGDEEQTDPWLQAVLGRLDLALGDRGAALERLARGARLRREADELEAPRLAAELADLARRLGDDEQRTTLDADVERLTLEQGRGDELRRLRRELRGR